MERNYHWLMERLSERNAHPERAEAIDKELWKELGQTCAILVSDTSGFTRITKECGTLHFLSLVQKGVALSRPLIEKESGILLKQEADNMLCVFPLSDQALRAGVGIIRALRSHNEGIEDGNSQIGFCLGLGYGKTLRLTDDIFGDAVNVASKLGEDTAERDELIFSKAAGGALTGEVAGCTLADWETVRAGNVDIPYRKVLVS